MAKKQDEDFNLEDAHGSILFELREQIMELAMNTEDRHQVLTATDTSKDSATTTKGFKRRTKRYTVRRQTTLSSVSSRQPMRQADKTLPQED